MTLIVSVIITLSLSMFLLHRFYVKEFVSHYISVVQLQHDIKSATLLIEGEEALWPENPRFISVNQQTKVECKLQEWGFYSVIEFQTSKQNKHEESIRLFGSDIFRQPVFPSVYYTPKKKFLSVGGDTFLGGDLYLPENGLQKATLEGKTYDRRKLHFGAVYSSEKQLPNLHSEVIRRIETIFSNDLSAYNVVVTTLENNMNSNSFRNSLRFFSLPDVELLRNVEFEGKVLIKAGRNIVLDSTCIFDNCILIADNIVFDNGFRGRGQFFATEGVTIKKGATIDNPSLICMWNPEGHAQMVIEDSCRVYGDIIAKAIARKKTPVLTVGESYMSGQIYCDGMLQFEGVLFGSLYANNIVYLEHYFPVENYLYNCCIDATRLPREYVGISFFDIYLNRKYAETVF